MSERKDFRIITRAYVNGIDGALHANKKTFVPQTLFIFNSFDLIS